MTPKILLSRWVAIERGDGIEQLRRITRYLTVGAFAICVAVVLLGIYFALPPLLFVFPGIAIGWLIAERNALQSRVAQWPVIRRYIDWARVDNDLQGLDDG
jgi:hypothetical protein